MNFLFGLKKEPEKISEGFQPLRPYGVLLTQTQIDNFYLIKKTVMRDIYDNHLRAFFTDAQLKEFYGELSKLAKSEKDALNLATFLQQKIQDYSEYFPLKHYLIDDFAFLRHLKEYGWNVAPAAKGMVNALLYHVKEMPATNKAYLMENNAESAKTGYCYHCGFDKEGRAIMWIQLSKDNGKTDELSKEEKYRHIVNVYENCFFDIMKNNDLLKKNPEQNAGVRNPFQKQACWVADAQNIPGNLVSYVMALKTVIDKFGQNHAESSGKMIIINAPFLANMIIPLIQPFLSKEQQDKYVFISGKPEKIKEELSKYVDMNQLPPEFTDGKSGFPFNFQKEIEKDRIRFQVMTGLCGKNEETKESAPAQSA